MLQSIGSQKVGHDGMTKQGTFYCHHHLAKESKRTLTFFCLTDSRRFMLKHDLKSPLEACYHVADLLHF